MIVQAIIRLLVSAKSNERCGWASWVTCEIPRRRRRVREQCKAAFQRERVSKESGFRVQRLVVFGVVVIVIGV